MRKRIAFALAALVAWAVPAAAMPVPSFSVADASAAENSGALRVTITKSVKTNSYSRIAYQVHSGTAKPGVDYVYVSGTLTFTNGQLSNSFSVPLIDNAIVDGSRTFTVQISIVRFGTLSRAFATGTITDNDVAASPPPPLPQPAPTQTCPDGTVIRATSMCPMSAPAPAPMPAPSGGYVLSPTPEGNPALAASFDINLALDSGLAIPGIYSPDEGAFRFVCGGDGQILADDPMIFPGQPGKSHPHQFFGNTTVNANTTDVSLATGASNCNASPYVVNHSGYWIPAMEDDLGHFVRPDLIVQYYKRYRSISKFCDLASPTRTAVNGCAPLPNGIRFISGWDPTRPDQPGEGSSWYCTTGTGLHYTTLDDVFNSGCVAGSTLVADIMFANCWDAKYLDTPDHRSHVAFPAQDGYGNLRCPTDHPKLIPQPENKVEWTVTAAMIGTRADGTKYSRVRLSSDAMKLNARPGETLHSDYWEKWVGAVKDLWMANCIEKGLNCNSGELGNGQMIKGAMVPVYGWKLANPLEPMPAMP